MTARVDPAQITPDAIVRIPSIVGRPELPDVWVVKALAVRHGQMTVVCTAWLALARVEVPVAAVTEVIAPMPLAGDGPMLGADLAYCLSHRAARSVTQPSQCTARGCESAAEFVVRVARSHRFCAAHAAIVLSVLDRKAGA